MCVYVCKCACESMCVWVCECVCVCCSVRLVGVCPSVVETADEDGVVIHIFQSSKTDHPPLGSQLRPSIDQSQMSTDLSRPVHDTWHKANRQQFSHHPIHPPILSLVHVTWSCTVSIRSLTNPHTCSLSRPLSIPLSHQSSSLWWQISSPLSREMMEERQREKRRTFQLET